MLALALLCLWAGWLETGRAQELVVTGEDGARLLALDLRDAPAWCVLWNHSVTGFLVQDCYRLENGLMLLVSHHTPDFAAGLGPIAGRGELVSDGQDGYIIQNIDELVIGNHYLLRVGSMRVNHRIQHGASLYSLSELAAGARVIVAVQEKKRGGS